MQFDMLCMISAIVMKRSHRMLRCTVHVGRWRKKMSDARCEVITNCVLCAEACDFGLTLDHHDPDAAAGHERLEETTTCFT